MSESKVPVTSIDGKIEYPLQTSHADGGVSTKMCRLNLNSIHSQATFKGANSDEDEEMCFKNGSGSQGL
jgi:DUF4097 and DUF4098 domain-containing protein YvlB